MEKVKYSKTVNRWKTYLKIIVLEENDSKRTDAGKLESPLAEKQSSHASEEIISLYSCRWRAKMMLGNQGQRYYKEYR